MVRVDVTSTVGARFAAFVITVQFASAASPANHMRALLTSTSTSKCGNIWDRNDDPDYSACVDAVLELPEGTCQGFDFYDYTTTCSERIDGACCILESIGCVGNDILAAWIGGC